MRFENTPTYGILQFYETFSEKVYRDFSSTVVSIQVSGLPNLTTICTHTGNPGIGNGQIARYLSWYSTLYVYRSCICIA